MTTLASPDATPSELSPTPAGSVSPVTRIVLNTGWRVSQAGRDEFPEHRQLPWLPAEVPGHVHLDLMRAGVIPDPFRRLYERDVEWVDEADWIYETTFTVADLTPAHRYLLFHGLDTVAEITLNGEELGRADNMYIPHRFSVDGRLRLGANTVRVTFRSALRTGNARKRAWEEANGEAMPEQWDRWSTRSFVRQAQYTFGWDWGPVLTSCGLWQPVELVTVPVAEMGDWKYEYEFPSEGQVTVRAEAAVHRHETGPSLTLHISVAGVAAEIAVPAQAGTHTLALPAIQVHASRWQPQGLGDPARYPLSLTLRADGDETPLDTITARIGFRTVELIREPDADGQGEGFQFRINGESVFIKGANWIPENSFPARITPDRLRARITQARDAGFNMLRVWGGGLYESEDFYDLCDELGLLVWQDFPYACAYYPDNGEYADAGRLEATTAVRRIRNHPSLALWCGNNENLTMYEGPWGGVRPPRFLGENFYYEILPAVIAAEDPKTPYWPSSPNGAAPGTDDSNSADYGDCHNWDVWHGRGDWVHYTENDSRFCSEFGFAASCSLAAWDTVLDPATDRSPRSPAVQWHDKTRKGYETYIGYSDIHFPVMQTLEDLVYYSQLNQAEALKYGVEHYRRRKGRCWGTLFWQFNDCWPVQSWAIVDFLGEPRAAYFACKKFYAPLLVSLVREGETAHAHLVSDLLSEVSGELTLSLLGFDGRVLHRETKTVTVAANVSALVGSVSLSAAQGRERSALLHARFVPQGDAAAVENILLLAEPKDLALAAPAVRVETAPATDGRLSITVSSAEFAPYVWLRAQDDALLAASDNFFHLLPGESQTVTVTPPADVIGMDWIVVRTLAG